MFTGNTQSWTDDILILLILVLNICLLTCQLLLLVNMSGNICKLFYNYSIMGIMPRSLMSSVPFEGKLIIQHRPQSKLFITPVQYQYYHHHRCYQQHQSRLYASSSHSRTNGITAVSWSAAGFNNYEQEKKSFHLKKPQYYNFATDVIDKWAKVSKALLSINYKLYKYSMEAD